MKNYIIPLGILCLSLFAGSCYNDSEEALYGLQNCDLTNVTYAQSVQPIIENNCYSCHSSKNAANNGAFIVLDTYQDLMTSVNNGLLMESITHGGGASPMPKNAPKLSDCEINTIKTWIDNGAKND